MDSLEVRKFAFNTGGEWVKSPLKLHYFLNCKKTSEYSEIYCELLTSEHLPLYNYRSSTLRGLSRNIGRLLRQCTLSSPNSGQQETVKIIGRKKILKKDRSHIHSVGRMIPKYHVLIMVWPVVRGEQVTSGTIHLNLLMDCFWWLSSKMICYCSFWNCLNVV